LQLQLSTIKADDKKEQLIHNLNEKREIIFAKGRYCYDQASLAELDGPGEYYEALPALVMPTNVS
jgi:hypothetical protein